MADVIPVNGIRAVYMECIINLFFFCSVQIHSEYIQPEHKTRNHIINL